MPIYKAPNNDTFRLDDPRSVDQLPEGCVEISETELASIIISRAVPANTVPQTITAFQAYAILDAKGLLDAVETWANDPKTPRIHYLAWTKARDFERDSPLINAAAQQFNLTQKDLDDLFTEGAKVKA